MSDEHPVAADTTKMSFAAKCRQSILESFGDFAALHREVGLSIMPIIHLIPKGLDDPPSMQLMMLFNELPLDEREAVWAMLKEPAIAEIIAAEADVVLLGVDDSITDIQFRLKT